MIFLYAMDYASGKDLLFLKDLASLCEERELRAKGLNFENKYVSTIFLIILSFIQVQAGMNSLYNTPPTYRLVSHFNTFSTVLSTLNLEFVLMHN
mgnify:CR=1 FL=1